MSKLNEIKFLNNLYVIDYFMLINIQIDNLKSIYIKLYIHNVCQYDILLVKLCLLNDF